MSFHFSDAHPAATNLASSASLAPLPQAGGVGGGHTADPALAPDTALFSRERQTVFLGALAASGSVRSASARAGISHQTAYRARLASPGFRRAWDAALLAARAQAEEVLACRALDGIEEDVVYHGEVVATRRRFSDRLLLAHLARLDRLCGDAEVAQFADAFDDTLARYAAGEDRPARPLDEPGVSGSCSDELWSMRSTGAGQGGENSPVPLHHPADGPPPRCGEEPAIPPALPRGEERGGRMGEAQQLDVGVYEVWRDEASGRLLTTWPAPPDFAGEELALHPLCGEVLGPWPHAGEATLAGPPCWARTLSAEEEAGLLGAAEARAAHRAARLALYHRAAFGLASEAECASIAAANDGDTTCAAPRLKEFTNANFS